MSKIEKDIWITSPNNTKIEKNAHALSHYSKRTVSANFFWTTFSASHVRCPRPIKCLSLFVVMQTCPLILKIVQDIFLCPGQSNFFYYSFFFLLSTSPTRRKTIFIKKIIFLYYLC